MPWCPKCKAEYQEGYTKCSDCNVELVDELPKEPEIIPFFQVGERKVAEKLVDYFSYSDLKANIEYDEKNEMYVVTIPAELENQARKLYQGFYFVEHEKQEQEEATESNLEDGSKEADDGNTDHVKSDRYGNSDIDDDSDEFNDQEEENDFVPTGFEADSPISEFSELDADNGSSVYVMKEDQYKDLYSSVWIFLFFGVVGMIIVLLNITGVLSIFNGWLPNLVMTALFLFFIYVSLSSFRKAKKVQSEIEVEKQMTEKINQWLKANVTDSFLASVRDDNISSELNYIKISDKIKKMLMDEFGEQNPAYLDRLIDEFYSITFDEKEEKK